MSKKERLEVALLGVGLILLIALGAAIAVHGP